MLTIDTITDVYGPQLGELAWHSLNVDPRIRDMSEQHAAIIVRLVEEFGIKAGGRPLRILEVGAYAHYGAHSAASTLKGVSFAHDVSPASLKLGLKLAREAGFDAKATIVAGDFHDLPFETGYFDIVFCASSIHHTFRPWKPLSEMMRVLRPGGVLHLENEPIGRAFCFYNFRSNRAEQLTPFEAELTNRGLMWTLSSPFPGTRPEALFGMVENERIPLDIVLSTLKAEGKFERLSLQPQSGELEDRLLALPRDVDLEFRIAELLTKEIGAVRDQLTPQDVLLGVRLPDRDQIWTLSYLVAPRLSALGHLPLEEQEFEMARLFGATFQATIRKNGRGEGATTAFRRQPISADEVLDDLPRLRDFHLALDRPQIPSIEDRDRTALETVYSPEDWTYRDETDSHGILSLANRRQRCEITIGSLPSRALVLLRISAAATAAPYQIVLVDGQNRDLAKLVVVQSESLLFREIVEMDAAKLAVETRSMAGEPLSLVDHVILHVGRLIPIEQIENVDDPTAQGPTQISACSDEKSSARSLLRRITSSLGSTARRTRDHH